MLINLGSYNIFIRVYNKLHLIMINKFPRILNEICDRAVGIPLRLQLTRINFLASKINWILLQTGEDAEDVDHYLSPEERMKIILGWH